MTDIAVVGLGKMGLSHLSIVNAHPDVRLVGACDASGFVLDVLSKYTGLPVFEDYAEMLDKAAPEAVIIATPTALHEPMIRSALERGIHVFCEKPLFLDPSSGSELVRLADERGLVTQVGYHNRFVAAFAEAGRLLQAGAIGTVTTALAEAYGPVVLKAAGRTWRSKASAGGGSLYDYAAHPLNLITWYLGAPEAVSGSRLTSIFSSQTDDAVAATLHYPQGTAQLSVNWSDESQRKMTTRITLWGTRGRIYVDRQELQLYIREDAPAPEGYRSGWNVRYTTDMTQAPWFYLRGEEYSAQIAAFVDRVQAKQAEGLNDFASALLTDKVIKAISSDAVRVGGRWSLEDARAVTAAPPERQPAGGAAIRVLSSGLRGLAGRARRLAERALRGRKRVS